MKKLVLVLVAMFSLTGFAKADYCKKADELAELGFKKVHELSMLAAEQTDMDEVDRLIAEIKTYTDINQKLADICSDE